MGSVNSRTGKLYLDFRYRGTRCREQTHFDDTPANRRRLNKVLEVVESEIRLNQFDYEKYFPSSAKVEHFNNLKRNETLREAGGDLTFSMYAERWFELKKVEWRPSQRENVKGILDKHIIPCFGKTKISTISKHQLLSFRAALCEKKKLNGKKLSASRVNHILSALRMIVDDAAHQISIDSPWKNIKALSVPRTSIKPFRLDEVIKIIQGVPRLYQNYFTVRFFTGLRTGEIDGLKWDYVDFERKELLIQSSLVNGVLQQTKTNGSYRTVDICDAALKALKSQFLDTGEKGEFVFSNRVGRPLEHRNVTKRIWYPTLDRLNIERRNPYQTRHTTATLWLAAGEAPEWIAKQLGHSTTAMLFRVYSRYVPNLTRNDGSAFESLLKKSGVGAKL